ncbi:MAG: c-type cytochrome [Candidatus Marinarcus sp.]|uniref:c-type cytochrome n=1 Tax=Candidatus Marinarcus sp. TaxID=3100987 RepID=UPI003AFF6531
MKKILILTSILATLSFAGTYAQKCVSCHGANGETSAMQGKSKIIKDMTKAEIVTALKGYKDGSYGGPLKGLMKAQVSSLTDAQIEEIATTIGK